MKGVALNTDSIISPLQSAGSVKDEKDKGKKAKKGKGKEDPIKKPAPQKQQQKPRSSGSAVKKPEETGGVEELEVKAPGEDGAAGDQEDKVAYFSVNKR